MPSTSSKPTDADYSDPRIRSMLESGLTFHLKAGGAKWKCTLLDRNVHERQKALRTDSSESISSADSASSSSSSTKSH
ncbi:hypothetical protein QBC35DRAFT_6231 [Podospora australis]|uniref:Uncharacterized protein n=1 Tax=Podospora australis TaxID=1536484 RepID=A0AAN7AQC0_9PEZI|nr:hypothetical protein QBC35DRAFT_6231 [Podospora australis]